MSHATFCCTCRHSLSARPLGGLRSTCRHQRPQRHQISPFKHHANLPFLVFCSFLNRLTRRKCMANAPHRTRSTQPRHLFVGRRNEYRQKLERNRRTARCSSSVSVVLPPFCSVNWCLTEGQKNGDQCSLMKLESRSTLHFYARKRLLLSARLSHRNSVCPSVRLSHGWISQRRCKLESPNLHRRLP